MKVDKVRENFHRHFRQFFGYPLMLSSRKLNANVSRDMFIKILERLFENSNVDIFPSYEKKDTFILADRDWPKKRFSGGTLRLPKDCSIAFVIIIGAETWIRVKVVGEDEVQEVDLYDERWID